ncbi:MAG: A/G-specific adenine glycosylase [Candidatus Aminicenantes bacterium]|nr:MAG: A/G-specific adenine glycosylase [Candidatus Aminicenantes bacterium]
MKLSEQNAVEFQRKLKAWYSAHQRKLPWRETQDPYKIWISEVMLQQTTVQTVIPYYTKWMTFFPDMHTLSKAPLQKVLKVWQGLGYYKRAKNLHQASKIIMTNFDGKIPQNYDDLKNLPGLGPYTTAALLSIAFDKPYLTIDANVRRILMRLLKLSRKSTSSIDRKLHCYFSPFLPVKSMGIFNQALMELGSLVCRPKNPLCLLCPILEYCRAYESGKQEVIPIPEKRSYKKIQAVIGIIEKNNKFLIQKRPSTGLLADLWEFPGGKIEKGEKAKQALRREMKEELGTEIHDLKFLTKVQHSYTQFQVTLHAFACNLKTNPVLIGKRHRWVSLHGMRQLPFPSGSAKVIRFLEKTRNKP